MTKMIKTVSILAAASMGATLLTGCASGKDKMSHMAPTPDYKEGTVLTRNAIGVEKKTEFLEIDLHPEASQLSLADRNLIRGFVFAYRDGGHGPLIMSMPQSSSNPQLAVAAVSEARAIAYEAGVAYEEIAGSAHGAGSVESEPMILAFQAYEAIAPECHSAAAYDYADFSSNNELGSLGCSIRSNQAAMIADPADLLGQRALGQGDGLRRDVILAKFREGQTTGAERSADETGTVSEAVAE